MGDKEIAPNDPVGTVCVWRNPLVFLFAGYSIWNSFIYSPVHKSYLPNQYRIKLLSWAPSLLGRYFLKSVRLLQYFKFVIRYLLVCYVRYLVFPILQLNSLIIAIPLVGLVTTFTIFLPLKRLSHKN